MATPWTGTLSFTTDVVGITGQADPLVPNPRGELPTKYNASNVTQAAVVLIGTTPKVWTHNCNKRPQKVELYTPGGVLVPTSVVTVACGLNTITLTAVSASINLTCIITWEEDCTLVNGYPAANFA